MILLCDCQHQAQDFFHGKGKRVHNVLKKPAARCTVCGKEKSISVQEAKDNKRANKK